MLPAKYSEVAFCRCFVKNVFFKRFLKVHRETPVLGNFLIQKHDCNGLPAYKCQRAGYQFNQRFILKIQRVLVSHKLKDHGHFWPHLKIDETTFSFPDFVPACKKSFYSISSFLRYSKFQNPVTRLVKTFFDHVHSKMFQSSFNLRGFVPACKQLIPPVHS